MNCWLSKLHLPGAPIDEAVHIKRKAGLENVGLGGVLVEGGAALGHGGKSGVELIVGPARSVSPRRRPRR